MAAEADHRGRHPHGVATNPSSGHPRMDREGQGPEHDAKGRSCGRGREKDRRAARPNAKTSPARTPCEKMETQSCGHKFLGRPTKEAGCHGLILFPVKDSREAPSPPGWNLEDRHDDGAEESRERARDPRLHVAFLGALPCRRT